MTDYPRDLDHSILEFKTNAGIVSWSVRNAMEGVQIFGGIGSGKTSGSGSTLAHKYLANGFGGLVLTAKHDEADTWVKYCKNTGRLDDLIIVDPQHQNYFDFLAYESQGEAFKTPITLNIVQVIKTVIRARDDKDKGKSDDGFWELALDMLISNTINLCLLAYGEVSIKMMYDIAQTALRKSDPIPLTPQQKREKLKKEQKERQQKGLPEPELPQNPLPLSPFQKAFDLAMHQVTNMADNWKRNLPKDQKGAIKDAAEYTRQVMDAIPQVRTMNFIRAFFTDTYRNIAEKTRSIIDFSLMGFLYNLLQEPTYSLFCSKKSNFTPEDSIKGKIIVINLPVKDYFKVGQDAQIMFKYIWQRAMERRRLDENSRPVFLWADEAQHFLHEHDADFQATARSSRIATVYLSQNIPNYYANMGGQQGDHKVKSFLGTLSTKIFHANADIETNKYAAELIGNAYSENKSAGASMSDGGYSVNQSSSYQLEQPVRPEEFGLLKTGGPLNNNKIEAYIHVQGKEMGAKVNFKKISFTQVQKSKN